MLDLSAFAGPTITLTYGSVLGLIFVFLSFNVAMRRGKTKISHGFGPNNELAPIVRAQENFAEYVPFTLLLIGGLEMTGTEDLWLRLMAGGLVVARISHAFGLYNGEKAIIFRALGAMLTYVVLLAASIFGLVTVLS